MFRIPRLHLFAALALACMLVLTAPVAANEIQGTLTQLNADDYTFSVRDDAGNMQNFQLRVDGQILINGAEQTLWDLKQGERVRVTYQADEDSGLVATMIRATGQ